MKKSFLIESNVSIILKFKKEDINKIKEIQKIIGIEQKLIITFFILSKQKHL